MAEIPPRSSPLRAAIGDFSDAARLWRLVGALGWLDIRLRYRGSWLGPLWLGLSTAIMVLALGLVYPALFHLSAREYVPYLAVSLVLWNALAQLVTDASQVFVAQEAVIHAIRLPFAVHAARALLRTVIAMAHQAAVLVPVFLLFGIVPGGAIWTVPPALMLWLLDGFCLLLILGALGARFRDLPPILASAMQLAFFLTPVIWRGEQLGPNAAWLLLNPLHAMIEILRAPLLGQPVPGAAWAVALASSFVLVAASGLVFAHARSRLAFWV